MAEYSKFWGAVPFWKLMAAFGVAGVTVLLGTVALREVTGIDLIHSRATKAAAMALGFALAGLLVQRARTRADG